MDFLRENKKMKNTNEKVWVKKQGVKNNVLKTQGVKNMC